MKTIHELLLRLLMELEAGNFNGGLCRLTGQMAFWGVITGKEERYLDRYIRRHCYTARAKNGRSFLWMPDDIHPRIEFIKFHLTVNKPRY